MVIIIKRNALSWRSVFEAVADISVNMIRTERKYSGARSHHYLYSVLCKVVNSIRVYMLPAYN